MLPVIASRQPLRILVADDNEMLLSAVRGLLQSLGHAVVAVANGREAVESAANKHFDVVFLDLQMPEMDGMTAASALRQAREGKPGPRIIGLSGESEDRWASAGMDEFLMKPVRLADLVHVLQSQERS